MHIRLLVVGKTTDNRVEQLIGDYHKRLVHYVPFDIVVIPELKNTRALTQEQQKQAEGELILHALPKNSRLILLDEHGREYRSVEFAAQLQQLMTAGQDVTYVVGGPYGFSRAVYDRADGLLSLSKMTFSHQLIRALFAEQLYRAMTILRSEPYHHE
ncbi:MAG: 23S rRNA (pseudouridine(1915)-N(3))-methyltransferase RlmH [Paludibacteraceae bacterium]|nr:23S rRNA (pseudouridine(1915)-N(3))-methyltransferase RlmH [Paludibacteraceae bacterium]